MAEQEETEIPAFVTVITYQNRITIPKHLRDVYGLRPGDLVEVTVKKRKGAQA